MEKERIKPAMNVILLLMLIIVLQHVTSLLHSPAGITMPLNFIVIPVVGIYFLQLHRIFSFYFKMNNLPAQLITITACYLFLFFINAIFKVADHGRNSIISDNESLNRILIMGLVFMSLAIQLVLIVMNFILGAKLRKQTTSVRVKNLGNAFYGAGIYYILLLLFSFSLSLLSLHYFFIILELLPYWVTYRIYSRILRSEIQEEAPADFTMSPE